MHVSSAIAVIALLLGAAQAAEDDVDYVEIASVLVQDGNYDRAEETLRQIDENDEDLNRAKYFTLWGLIYLNRRELPAAKENFQKAVETGEVEPVIHIYLAQVQFDLEEYRSAIASLNRAGAVAERLPSVYAMRAHAHWLLEEHGTTWAVLDDARVRFPANHSFLRRKVFYLIELGLFQGSGRPGPPVPTG